MSDENRENRPAHYRPDGAAIEPIDLIEAQKLNFSEGNVVKYVCRARHKGEEIADLHKARWYLERLIRNAEGRGLRKIRGPK